MTCTIRPMVNARSCLKKINGGKDKHMNTKLNRVIEEIDKIEKRFPNGRHRGSESGKAG